MQFLLQCTWESLAVETTPVAGLTIKCLGHFTHLPTNRLRSFTQTRGETMPLLKLPVEAALACWQLILYKSSVSQIL